MNEVVKEVAAGLRNTPAVCRKSYINPAVFTAWQSGELRRLHRAPATGESAAGAAAPCSPVSASPLLANQECPHYCASAFLRAASNSSPGFHVGMASACATSQPA